MSIVPLSTAVNPWGAPTLDGFDVSQPQEGVRIGGQSNRQFVRFYKKIVPVVKADQVAINPNTGEVRVKKFKIDNVEKEFVEVITPGDTNKFNDVAEDYHKREFWQHYKAFREGRSAPVGTPVSEAEWISSGIATELMYHGCHTLEQLADASDYLCNILPSGWELREYAKAVCKVNQENKSLGQVHALQEQLAQMQAEMEEMRKKAAARDEALERQLQSMETAQEKRGRGRPSKHIVLPEPME